MEMSEGRHIPVSGPMSNLTLHHIVVRGKDPILQLRHLLVPFSEQCGQPGTTEDLPYFLAKPGLLSRIPTLYLVVSRPGLSLPQVQVEDLVGVAILYEYKFFGIRTGLFTSNDRSGRGSIIASETQRLDMALYISGLLIRGGGRAVLLSLQGDQKAPDVPTPAQLRLGAFGLASAKVALRARSLPAYLTLQPTYDGTLGKLGQKTRSNIRYYRRRAEAQLKCTFIPQVEISEDDLLAFNKETMFAVPDRDALWRLRTQGELTDPFLMGMKDGDGRWLSVLAGRRHKTHSEILWQMNRDGLPNHSLSTVIRAYCMEHEIARAATRLYIEGGTKQSIQNTFECEIVMDLSVVRNAMWASLLRRLSKRMVFPDNVLATMLDLHGREQLETTPEQSAKGDAMQGKNLHLGV
jgi:hypothetical protein